MATQVGTTNNTALNTFISRVDAQLITPAVSLLALMAFVLFIWGVIQYIQGSADEEKRQTGQRHILWGIIGLIILFGANAIVKIIGVLAGVFG